MKLGVGGASARVYTPTPTFACRWARSCIGTHAPSHSANVCGGGWGCLCVRWW